MDPVPAELPLGPGQELHVKADRVSLEYRRWLKELALAARSGPAALRSAIGADARAHDTRGPDTHREVKCAT